MRAQYYPCITRALCLSSDLVHPSGNLFRDYISLNQKYTGNFWKFWVKPRGNTDGAEELTASHHVFEAYSPVVITKEINDYVKLKIDNRLIRVLGKIKIYSESRTIYSSWDISHKPREFFHWYLLVQIFLFSIQLCITPWGGNLDFFEIISPYFKLETTSLI